MGPGLSWLGPAGRDLHIVEEPEEAEFEIPSPPNPTNIATEANDGDSIIDGFKKAANRLLGFQG